MSVMKRVRDITVATLNDMIEKSENPVRVIDQFILKRKEKIQEIQSLIHTCQRHNDAVKYQYIHAMQIAEKREGQAAIALKADEEELARQILQEKIEYEEKAEQYKALLVEGEQTLEDAKVQLSCLQDELREVMDKRHYYVSRLESIQLQQKFKQHFDQVVGGKHVVRRLEDRISEMEWDLKAKQNALFDDTLYQDNNLTRYDLDLQLAKLKQKMSHKGE